MLTYNKDLNQTIKSVSDFTDPNCQFTYENHKVSKTILLIGNGFDLRAKIKSSFNDFIVFIIYGCILHNSYNNFHLKDRLPEIIQNQKENLKTLPEQLNILLNKFDSNIYKSCHEFAETLLGKTIFTHVFSSRFYYAFLLLGNDASLNPDDRWDKNSVLTLYGLNSSPSGNIFNLSYSNLNKGLETITHVVDTAISQSKTNLKLWLDVECVIEILIAGTGELKNKYIFNEEVKKDHSSIESYAKGLNLFEHLLTYYLKEAQKIKIDGDIAIEYFNDIQNKYLHSLAKRSHHRIENIDISHPDIVINYNYTDVATRYFSAINSHPKIIHINGSINIPDELQLNEIETNIVIGYTKPKETKVPKEAFPFEKSLRRIIKNTEYLDIDSLIGSGDFDLVIMGHSCGIADSDIISKLLTNPNLKSAVVLCHSLNDLISSVNNIKAMLGDEQFGKLMTFSKDEKFNNLYFSVEKEK